MNNVLPIGASRGVIEQAVQLHRVVVIQAETGAGKSTQVPQYLLNCAKRVIVTQPRRIAASTIAQQVAEEMEVKLGTIVGYRTATDSRVSKDTRLIFCTDGLLVMQQMFDIERYDDAIIIIDEAHEWNLNLELLIAWFRLKLSQGLNLRLVIMSATIEAELLQSYFGDAEVISSKGRTFPITEIAPKGGIVSSIKMLLRQNCNVLVFVPGKAEINRLIRILGKTHGVDAEILPLHAGLSHTRQSACFAEYERPKCVVSTNVAQTSITVPDIDAVVDSGMERRQELTDGVEGLYLRPISLSDREQRKGRAGRVRPGIYVDCCPIAKAERRIFPRAAILTRSLEGLILQLAQIGLRPEELKFFHKPWQRNIDLARNILRALQCIDDEEVITAMGKLVVGLPIGIRYGRLIMDTYQETKHGGRVDETAVTIAAILQEGSVRRGRNEKWRQYAAPLPYGGASDAYEELIAFEAALVIPNDKLTKYGIDSVAFDRVKDIRQKVLVSLRRRGIRLWRNHETTLQRAIVSAFADQLYKRSLGSGVYLRVSSKASPRSLPAWSTVKDSEFVVGIPWNNQVNSEFGPKTIRTLRAATAVDPAFAKRLSTK